MEFDIKRQWVNVGLGLEKKLADQMLEDICGDAIEFLLNNEERVANFRRKRDDILKRGIQFNDKIGAGYWTLFEETQSMLGFEEPVNLFCGAQMNNACAMLSPDPEQEPHIICYGSGYLHTGNRDVTRMIMAHELGHLIHKDAVINTLLRYIYNEESLLPPNIRLTKNVMQQLREIRCDRYGYLVAENWERWLEFRCQKMFSLNFKMLGINAAGFLSYCREQVQELQEHPEKVVHIDHPEIAVRVRAMEIFATNDNLDDIERETELLVDLISQYTGTPRQKLFAKFYSSAGLLIAGRDGKVTESEKKVIKQSLARMTARPSKYIQDFDMAEAQVVFDQSVEGLLNDSQSNAEDMLDYMISICMAEQRLKKDDVEFVFDIAVNKFKMSKRDVLLAFRTKLGKDYKPLFRN